MRQILKDIGLYKSVIINSLLDNQEIMELMLGKKYTDSDVENIVYKQIFPYLYIDETQTETKTYICCEVNIPRIPTATIKDLTITIWAFCHKDIMQYSKKGYKGSRTDILSDMIERCLCDSDKFGIGKLHLDSVTHIYPNTKTYGRQMIFTIPDFKMKEDND